MKIGLRVLLGYFLIVAVAALLLVNVFVQQVKPGVRQAMEDTLADTANVLAELASDDLLAGRINQGQFAGRIRNGPLESLGAPSSATIARASAGIFTPSFTVMETLTELGCGSTESMVPTGTPTTRTSSPAYRPTALVK